MAREKGPYWLSIDPAGRPVGRSSRAPIPCRHIRLVDDHRGVNFLFSHRLNGPRRTRRIKGGRGDMLAVRGSVKYGPAVKPT